MTSQSNLAIVARDLARRGIPRTVRRDVLLAFTGWKASRLVGTERGYLELATLSASLGLGCAASSSRFALAPNPLLGGFSQEMAPSPTGQHRLVIVAADMATAHTIADQIDDPSIVGRHLRIPKCCVQFYARAADAAAGRGGDFSPLIGGAPRSSIASNSLARYFDRGYFDYFPCRHDCEGTLEHAVEAAGVLAEVDPALAVDLACEGTMLFGEKQGVFWLDPLEPSGGQVFVCDATTDRTPLALALRGSHLSFDTSGVILQSADGGRKDFAAVCSATFAWSAQDAALGFLPPKAGSVPSTCRLKGRRALIAGGSGGFGRALSDALFRSGAAVVLGSRRPEARQRVLNELRQVESPTSVQDVDLDVLDPSSCGRAITLSRPDVLVIAAGVASPSENEMLATHVGGTRNLVESALAGRQLLDVVYVGSTEDVRTVDNERRAYASAKAVAVAWLRQQAGRCGMRVVHVVAGPTETNWRRPAVGRVPVATICRWVVDVLASRVSNRWIEQRFDPLN